MMIRGSLQVVADDREAHRDRSLRAMSCTTVLSLSLLTASMQRPGTLRRRYGGLGTVTSGEDGDRRRGMERRTDEGTAAGCATKVGGAQCTTIEESSDINGKW